MSPVGLARLQTIDHTTRNTAQTMDGVAEAVADLPRLSRDLSRVSAEFSGERRSMAADRVRIEAVIAANSKLENTVDRHHTAVTEDIAELKGWIKWAMGAVATATAIIGFLIHTHRT